MSFLQRHLSLTIVSLATVAALASAPFAFAQNAPQATSPSGPAAAVASAVPLVTSLPGAPPLRHDAAENGDAAHQGIKLHGHWTIDVKNPDGTTVQHRVFENQLQYDGTQYLTGLISGYAVAGDYAIFFTNATATPTASPTTNVVCPAPASTTTSTFPYCSIVQSVTSQPGIFHCLHYVCVSGLTVTPTFGSGTGLPNVTLVGAITAPQAGAVVNVYIGFNGCNVASTTTPAQPTGPATITPGDCESQIVGSYGGTMSGTTITPITVVAGQIIQITVAFTFS
jgi:hypothetical protein